MVWSPSQGTAPRHRPSLSGLFSQPSPPPRPDAHRRNQGSASYPRRAQAAYDSQGVPASVMHDAIGASRDGQYVLILRVLHGDELKTDRQPWRARRQGVRPHASPSRRRSRPPPSRSPPRDARLPRCGLTMPGGSTATTVRPISRPRSISRRRAPRHDGNRYRGLITLGDDPPPFCLAPMTEGDWEETQVTHDRHSVRYVSALVCGRVRSTRCCRDKRVRLERDDFGR